MRLSITFFIVLIVFTWLHELSHFAVAKFLGFDSRIQYGQTFSQNPKTQAYIDSVFSKHHEGNKLTDFPGKTALMAIARKYNKDHFLITSAGPIENILMGTFGLILLFIFRKSFNHVETLSIKQWVLIYIALSWVSETVNLFIWLVHYFLKGHFSRGNDEIKMAHYLHLPEWTIINFTGLLGLIVLATILFKLIPKLQRLTFLLSGLIGGGLGLLMNVLIRMA